MTKTKKTIKITIFITCTLCLLSLIWVVAWIQFGNEIIKNYYVKTIDKYGGISVVNSEANNIYDRIKLGFNFTSEIYKYSNELFPNLMKMGYVYYDHESKDIPMHIYIIQGSHFHKYYLEIYDSRIQNESIKSRGIEIYKNIRLVGWNWKDRFRFFR
jgi:hypothetical protein